MNKSIYLLASVAVIASCTNISKREIGQMTVQNPYDRVCITDQTTITHTKYGDVQGYKDGDIFTFKGIQYAKAERFMPPVAPDKHEGVLKCRLYGPKAPTDRLCVRQPVCQGTNGRRRMPCPECVDQRT